MTELENMTAQQANNMSKIDFMAATANHPARIAKRKASPHKIAAGRVGRLKERADADAPGGSQVVGPLQIPCIWLAMWALWRFVPPPTLILGRFGPS